MRLLCRRGTCAAVCVVAQVAASAIKAQQDGILLAEAGHRDEESAFMEIYNEEHAIAAVPQAARQFSFPSTPSSDTSDTPLPAQQVANSEVLMHGMSFPAINEELIQAFSVYASIF